MDFDVNSFLVQFGNNDVQDYSTALNTSDEEYEAAHPGECPLGDRCFSFATNPRYPGVVLHATLNTVMRLFDRDSFDENFAITGATSPEQVKQIKDELLESYGL